MKNRQVSINCDEKRRKERNTNELMHSQRSKLQIDEHMMLLLIIMRLVVPENNTNKVTNTTNGNAITPAHISNDVEEQIVADL